MQLDNFVDEELQDESSLQESTEYSPSFGKTERTEKSFLSKSKSASSPTLFTQITKSPPSKPADSDGVHTVEGFRDGISCGDAKAEANISFIEEFSLDANFDYDNIVLSSKFSSQELETMRNYRQGQVVSDECAEFVDEV
jgi:hypothetical protein